MEDEVSKKVYVVEIKQDQVTAFGLAAIALTGITQYEQFRDSAKAMAQDAAWLLEKSKIARDHIREMFVGEQVAVGDAVLHKTEDGFMLFLPIDSFEEAEFQDEIAEECFGEDVLSANPDFKAIYDNPLMTMAYISQAQLNAQQNRRRRWKEK